MRSLINLALMGLFGVACLVVAALALGPPPAGLADGQDKVLHFGAFLILTLLGGAAFHQTTVLAPAAGLLVGGICIELAQGLSFINRSPSVADFVADGAAVILGVVLVWTAKVLTRAVAPNLGERGSFVRAWRGVDPS